MGQPPAGRGVIHGLVGGGGRTGGGGRALTDVERHLAGAAAAAGGAGAEGGAGGRGRNPRGGLTRDEMVRMICQHAPAEIRADTLAYAQSQPDAEIERTFNALMTAAKRKAANSRWGGLYKLNPVVTHSA